MTIQDGSIWFSTTGLTDFKKQCLLRSPG
jgi:hypothetical protein